MLVAPTPLFPKFALLTTSVFGFSIALLATPEPQPTPEPRLLASYVYDPGGFRGAVVDLGEGPENLPLREFQDGAYLVSIDDYKAVVRVDGERYELSFDRVQRQDYARRAAPAYPPKRIGRTCGVGAVSYDWYEPEHQASICTTKRGTLWTPTPCNELRND